VSTTTYNLYNQPLVITESAGSTARTTTNGYDTAGRMIISSIAVVPTSAGGTAVPSRTIGYDSSTGLPTTVTAGNGTLTARHDSLGRISSYTDATGNAASTTYDTSGRIATINDGKGITTYTYDSASEHRGLLISEDLGLGSAPGTMTASYDAAGNATTVTYPNGLLATTRYDNAGSNTALSYAKSGTTWLSFTQTQGSHGNTAAEASPASSQRFNYDNAGRLSQTQDTVTDPVASTVVCTTRVYNLSNNSNRLSLASFPDDGGNLSGNCTTSTTPTVWNGSYDEADRLTNAGYAYDTLGRIGPVPGSPGLSAGGGGCIPVSSR